MYIIRINIVEQFLLCIIIDRIIISTASINMGINCYLLNIFKQKKEK